MHPSIYSDALLDHFRNPRNVGELDAPAITIEASNPACGDILRLSARVDNGAIAEARFKARGCTASIAAGSALTVWLVGRTRSELAGFEPAVVERAVGGLRAEN
jgi:nitrogen fixation NifU-like protein